jgi:hypothetical protein
MNKAYEGGTKMEQEMCDKCDKLVECEGRDAWIVAEQFFMCDMAGKPCWEDEDFFLMLSESSKIDAAEYQKGDR